MNRILFDAILSLDAYNRGYGAAIPISGTQIGKASIIVDSGILLDDSLVREDQPNSFYAVAYEYEGETIISYRGTDSALDGTAYTIGLGFTDSAQARLAFAFYNEVASIQNGNITIDPRLADISLTGHSLGGGLAGLVGAVYDKNALLYDNMAFENAAFNTQSSPFPEYIQTVYRNLSPWAATITPKDPDGPIITYSLKGEFLGYLNRGFQQTYEKEYSLPGNPNLDPYSPDLLELHSISALAIHIYAETEMPGQTQWHAASPHFWPVLFQDTFAQSIGFTNAAALTSMLAYSAIEHEVDGQGNVISQSVFGDTGIRTLYNDANDLGAALTLAGEGSAVEKYAELISQAFVQYAGQLALSKTLLSDIDVSIYQHGVLWGNGYPTLDVNDDWASGDRSLTVSFFEPLWSEATTEDVGIANMTARDELINTVITDTGIETNLRQYMLDWWGSDSPDNFDKVVFSTDNTKAVSLGRFSAKGGVFVGDADAEVVSGSTQDDLLLGFGGDNDFYTSYGEDIFIGGVNNDTVIATPRN